jgi:hypothetical protein
MVERMSFAIADADVVPESPHLYAKMARADILAIRNPTDAMISAALRGRDGTIPAAVIRSLWVTMVDAMLNEDNVKRSPEMIEAHNQSARADFPDRPDPRQDSSHPLHDIVCGWCGEIHQDGARARLGTA